MNKGSKATLIIVTSITTVLIAGYFFVYCHQTALGTIGGRELQLKIAQNSFQHKTGLGWHKKLKSNEGMLFIFNDKKRRGVWMKGMNFPIDVIWLDEKKKVVGLKKNLKPDSYPKTYYPNQKVKHFLEVESGFVEKYNIKIGDRLSLSQSHHK